MKSILIFVLIASFSLNAESQSKLYCCDSIPVHLRTGAKAVIRSCQRRITIIDLNKARIETRMIITLLNDRAKDLLTVGLPYDELRKISSIKASALDESGKPIWYLKKYNIGDIRNFYGPEKLGDSRKKYFEIPAFNYPFTMDYSYTMDVEDLFLSPTIYLQPDPEISVEESGIQYVIPKNTGFNYKTLNFDTPVDSILDGNRLRLSWKIENVPAFSKKAYDVDPETKLPVLHATPDTFRLKGYRGSLANWTNYGLWMGQLINGRDVLEDEQIKRINATIALSSSRVEKIQALYKYLQGSTHYYYVGFGIGGSQPMPAAEVATNGYGDCKALTNYMKAMLKTAGIESYYTLVRSGDGKTIQPDIACNQFDHVILCIPDEKDTIWLECTDPSLPPGYLGSFTCGREALAITPDGGKLVRTPMYGFNDNIALNNAEIVLHASGDASISLKIVRRGLLYNEIRRLSESTTNRIEQWISDEMGFSAFEILKENFTFSFSKKYPEANMEIDLYIPNFASMGGEMLFVGPSFISDINFIPYEPCDGEIGMAYQEFDSINILIPKGYKLEFLPSPRNISTRYGQYTSSLTPKSNSICFYRRLLLKKAGFMVQEYNGFHQFISDMARADKEMIILVKSE